MTNPITDGIANIVIKSVTQNVPNEVYREMPANTKVGLILRMINVAGEYLKLRADARIIDDNNALAISNFASDQILSLKNDFSLDIEPVTKTVETIMREVATKLPNSYDQILQQLESGISLASSKPIVAAR